MIYNEAKIKRLNEMEEVRFQQRQECIDMDMRLKKEQLDRERDAFLFANPDFDPHIASLMFVEVECPRKNYRIIHI